MLKKNACSIALAICATACALGLLPGVALAQTSEGNPTILPSPGPARHHRWTRPDYTDEELATVPDRLVPIPAAAKRGRAEFNGTPIIKLNGKTEQLAPGARVFGADNMLKVSGALNGRARIKYLREQNTGLLMDVWILTPKEIETPDPKPVGSSD